MTGCDGGDRYFTGGGGGGGKAYDSDSDDTRGEFFSWKWRSGGSGTGGGKNNGGRYGRFRGDPAPALKKAAEQGVAWLSDALAKLKSAAEDTAYAASRPRHW